MKRLVPTTSAALAAVLLSLGSYVPSAAASAECLDAVGTATQAYFNTVLEERTRVAAIRAGGGTGSSTEEERAAKTVLREAVLAACTNADLADFEPGSCGGQNPTLRKMVNCLAKHSNQAANYVLASIFARPVPATPTPRPTPKPTTSVVVTFVPPVVAPTLPPQTVLGGPCLTETIGDCRPPLVCVIVPGQDNKTICQPKNTTLQPVNPTPTPVVTASPPTNTPVVTPPPPTPTPTRTPTPIPTASPCQIVPPGACIQQGGIYNPANGCCTFN